MSHVSEPHSMHVTRRALLGTAAVVGLAGCLDGDDGGDDGMTATDDGTSSPTESPTGTPGGGATVQVRSHPEYGEILVGPNEMTLYMFDRDAQGEESSACTGGCENNWPPLSVDETPTAGDDVTAELATFQREDGGTQVTANGWPLYYYSGDESPGDANGQGVGEVWWVLDPAGEPVTSGGTPTPTATPTATDDDSGYY